MGEHGSWLEYVKDQLMDNKTTTMERNQDRAHTLSTFESIARESKARV